MHRNRLLGFAGWMAAAAVAVALPLVGGAFVLPAVTMHPSLDASAGQFRLEGIAGQPDAGLLTGGPFSLEGGFLHASAPERNAARAWRAYEATPSKEHVR